ncbi:MAG: hypothetical protein A2041_01520 [Bacteroidetes bacterium GWA2_31_9b]|nr:MAG: hypothetical protein A2041_01520 [Bacteroidetes bacterium GWA2_31_9b]
MKRINKNIVIVFLIIQAIVFFNLNIFSQEAIVVHNKVGVVIDSLENFNYLLFTDYSFDDIILAQVFKYPDNRFKLVVYLKNDSVVEKEIDKDYIKLINNKIAHYENNYVENDTINQYSIFLDDGSVLAGKIRSFTNKKIELFSESFDIIRIDIHKVVKVENYNHSEIKSITTIENPHYSRYFYAPSAMPLDKKEGYFQDIYLLLLSCNYSITSHILIGGGFSIIPGADINEQAYFLNAKVAYQITDKFYLGGGGLFFGIGAENSSFGIGYAVGTYGSKDHNATLGIGYGYSGDKLMETPVITVCGMTRLSKRISLLSENWLGSVTYNESIPPNFVDTRSVTEFHCLLSYGLRFFGEKISVDIAFLNVPTSEEVYFPGIPYIDFVVRF